MRDFRTLKVWEKAHGLALAVYQATARFPADERFGLTIQMRRSAASIPTMIAEACGTDQESDFVRIFQVAIRSCSDLEYQCILAKDLGFLAVDQHRSLEDSVIEVRKMALSYSQKVRTSRDTDN